MSDLSLPPFQYVSKYNCCQTMIPSPPMPSLYLLDKDKTVLLKDADYEVVRHAGIY